MQPQTMAMTDYKVQKQINHMIAFIDQEASEKIEEIDAKVEEEFNIEKGRIVQQERLKIMECYNKKEKAIDIQKKHDYLTLVNHGRIELLAGRHKLLELVIDEARSRMAQMSEQPKKYKTILLNLILAGFYQVMEPTVIVRCREKDVTLVESILPEAVDKYIEKTDCGLEVQLDRALYLSPNCSGGVEIIALHGRLKVDNSLDSRLDIICHQLEPQIRVALFGKNPSLKFPA